MPPRAFPFHKDLVVSLFNVSVSSTVQRVFCPSSANTVTTDMRASIASVLCVLLSFLVLPISSQQFQGSFINNTLPSVPGSEITYFNILDANKKNTTLINYSSLTGVSGGRLIPSQIERVIVFIHGMLSMAGWHRRSIRLTLYQAYNVIREHT